MADASPTCHGWLDGQHVELRRVLTDEKTSVHYNGASTSSTRGTFEIDRIIWILPIECHHEAEEPQCNVLFLEDSATEEPPRVAADQDPGEDDARTSSGQKDEQKEHGTGQLPSPSQSPVLRALTLPIHFLSPLTTWESAPLSANSPLTSPTIHVVISPTSGSGTATHFHERVLRPLLSHFKLLSTVQTHITTSANSIADLGRTVIAPQALRGSPQTVILLSGDGGVAELVAGLVAAAGTATVSGSPSNIEDGRVDVTMRDGYVPPTIALLAHGTGNALAHSSGVADAATAGLAALVRGTPHPLPLLQTRFSPDARLVVDEGRAEAALPEIPSATGEGDSSNNHNVLLGAVVASWALHSTLVADSDTAAYRALGPERFAIVGKALLYPEDGSPAHEFRGRVSVLPPSSPSSLSESDSALAHGQEEKEEWRIVPRETHLYLLATLVRQLEREFVVSPASRPLDGALRLLHFGPPMVADDCVRVIQRAFAGGTHVEEDGVGYEEVEGVRIVLDEEEARWRRLCVDGRIVRVERGGWMEVRRARGLRVVDLAWVEPAG